MKKKKEKKRKQLRSKQSWKIANSVVMDSPNSEISDANDDVDILDPEDDVEDEEIFMLGEK